jgi:hypothetical protein
LYNPQRPQGKKGDPATFYVPEGMQVTLQFQAPGSKNIYKWQRFNGSHWIDVSAWPAQYGGGQSYPIINASPSNVGSYRTIIQNPCLPGLQFLGEDILVILVPPLCQSEIPDRSGTFKLDKLTGTIIFERSDCTTKVPVSCVFGPSSTLDNVVSATAVTHADNWSYTFLGQSEANNPFESGERGKWRPRASYSSTAKLEQSKDKNFNAGTYKYKLFNWKYGEKSNYPGWLKVNQIDKYSPNGDPLEERNSLNIASTAKFGYKDVVPYLVAQNATYESVMFESFENEYTGGKFEDGFVKNGGVVETNGIFHSGKRSFKINGSSTITIRSFPGNSQIRNKGMQASVWAKGTINNSLELQLFDSKNVLINVDTFTWIASSGEWALYEAVLKPSEFSALSMKDVFSLKIKYTEGATIWVDDLRIQPKDAEMIAYVYDSNSLRLLTVFDDQHFGLFYQYNAEGKLVRKIIETERGMKTIQETQYNIKKTSK